MTDSPLAEIAAVVKRHFCDDPYLAGRALHQARLESASNSMYAIRHILDDAAVRPERVPLHPDDPLLPQNFDEIQELLGLIWGDHPELVYISDLWLAWSQARTRMRSTD